MSLNEYKYKGKLSKRKRKINLTMNKSSALVGIVSGLFGAGSVYILKSKDTIANEAVPKSLEANSNILNPKIRLSENKLKNYETAVKKSQELVKRFKDEIGVPGLVIGVSVDGNTVWEEGNKKKKIKLPLNLKFSSFF